MPLKHSPCLLNAVFVVCLVLGKCFGQDQASFAVLTGDVNQGSYPFKYDAIVFNRGGHLNHDTGHMTAPANGLYMVSMTSGAPGDTSLDTYIVRNGQREATAYRSQPSSSSLFDTIANDIILPLTSGQYITTGSYWRLHSTPTGLHTSWGSLALSGSMGTTVSFAVAVSLSNGNFPSGRVPFDRVLTNVGNIWDQPNNRSVIATSGIYYFFVKVALFSHSQGIFRFRVNGEEIFHLDRTHPTSGYGTLARAMMMNLHAGDVVDVYSTTGGYSWASRYTHFSGFLYNTNRNQKQAWAVYRTTSLSGSHDPFPYDDVRVNIGGSFIGNQVVCAYTGIYYIHISAGVQPNSRVQLTLMVGARAVGELLHTTLQNGVETLGRSLMIECNQGEVLRVVSSASSAVYSSVGLEAGFIGFYAFA